MEPELSVLEELEAACAIVARVLGRAPQLYDCHLDQALLVLALSIKRERHRRQWFSFRAGIRTGPLGLLRRTEEPGPEDRQRKQPRQEGGRGAGPGTVRQRRQVAQQARSVRPHRRTPGRQATAQPQAPLAGRAGRCAPMVRRSTDLSPSPFLGGQRASRLPRDDDRQWRAAEPELLGFLRVDMETKKTRIVSIDDYACLGSQAGGGESGR